MNKNDLDALINEHKSKKVEVVNDFNKLNKWAFVPLLLSPIPFVGFIAAYLTMTEHEKIAEKLSYHNGFIDGIEVKAREQI